MAEAKPAFGKIELQDNAGGWGPCTLPSQFQGVPYQPFSKSDRLGKAADFTSNAYHGRRDRYAQNYGAGGDIFYYDGEDDSNFQLVDTSKAPKPFFRGRRWQNRASRRDLHRARDERRTAGMQTLNTKQRERDRQRMEKRWQKRFGGRRRWDRRDIKPREPSVDVRGSWKVLEEIDFSRLTKLSLDPGPAKDLKLCGAVEAYDKTFDRIKTKSERPLEATERAFHKITTTDDPIIQEFSQQKVGNVFATDAILSTIMMAPRSVYSWDIVVLRVGDQLFLDKRDDSDFDYMTVSETAVDTPQDEGDHINSPGRLAMEATYINQAFSQQCLRHGAEYKFAEANPFAQEGESVASVGYRYRKWSLGNDLNLIARCEHDGVTKGKDGKPEFLSIKALTEYDPKAAGHMDWRKSLDKQKGAVTATELKNNNAKIAKWTACALLAGSVSMRIGYVSRVHPTDPQNHVILGSKTFVPHDIARQMNLDMYNGWGILRAVIDICMELDEGKYVILKDPMKSMMRIYAVPPKTFEEDSEDEEYGDMPDESQPHDYPEEQPTA